MVVEYSLLTASRTVMGWPSQAHHRMVCPRSTCDHRVAATWQKLTPEEHSSRCGMWHVHGVYVTQYVCRRCAPFWALLAATRRLVVDRLSFRRTKRSCKWQVSVPAPPAIGYITYWIYWVALLLRYMRLYGLWAFISTTGDKRSQQARSSLLALCAIPPVPRGAGGPAGAWS